MIEEWKAINIIAERAYENRKQLKQARRQRRTEFVDVYGVPMPLEYVGTKSGLREYETRVYVSNDLNYWERFQFKMEVMFDGEIDPDDFKFLIGERDDTVGDENLVDLSAELESQNGIWVDKAGYYPADEIVEETEDDDEEEVADDAGFFFDILEACSLKWADGDEENVNEILRSGTKVIQIQTPVESEVTFIPFIKYSTINR